MNNDPTEWVSIQFDTVKFYENLPRNTNMANIGQEPCDKSVPVTKAWRVLKLRVEERPPIWRVAANILNKPLRNSQQGVVLQLGGWARG
jgi:hypothetical protein